jgi:uncharacterized protein YodC (DUF2158 family)
MQATTDIRDGDVVRHKFGGPAMTISFHNREQIDDKAAHLSWFVTPDELKSALNVVAVLEKISENENGHMYSQERNRIDEGDVVYLRSGSPRMIVIITYKNMNGYEIAKCVWRYNDKQFENTFGAAALSKSLGDHLIMASIDAAKPKADPPKTDPPMVSVERALPHTTTVVRPPDRLESHKVLQPPEIQESLKMFQADHPDPRRAAFIMMRFAETDAHSDIVRVIQETAQKHGIKAMRADHKEYHDETFSNIKTYMHECGFGIAVFERLEEEAFNPNVGLEVGFLLALNKPVLLLKDRTLKTLQADLNGKLYRPFDTAKPDTTLPPVIEKWLKDKGFA